MIRKSRLVAALALALTVGLGGVAFAVGTDNNASVVGTIAPKKLDKKRFKKVSLRTGVVNDVAVTGMQVNPAQEKISFGKNVRVNLNKADRCSSPLVNGTSTAQARSLCPRRSYIGSGNATIQFPGQPLIADITVSVFNGPTRNAVRLHTFSPTLQAASPIINARITRSDRGRKYGKMLVVQAPETGSGLIRQFIARLKKSGGVVTARCKSKKVPFLREVTYKDGTSETAKTTQRCKRKRRR